MALIGTVDSCVGSQHSTQRTLNPTLPQTSQWVVDGPRKGTTDAQIGIFRPQLLWQFGFLDLDGWISGRSLSLRWLHLRNSLACLEALQAWHKLLHPTSSAEKEQS